MDKDAIRAALLNRQLKTVEISGLKDILPELMEVDESGQEVGAALLRELSGSESRMVTADAATSAAKLLATSLITRVGHEAVFSLTDIGSLMDSLGVSVINPLLEQAMTLSGMKVNAVPDAKNA